jgi:SRSO17 transposase
MAASRDWQAEFEAWLAPYLARLQRKEQRHWAPRYLQGLIGPGERKSVEPMAARVAPGAAQQLHHFIAVAPWDPTPLDDELVKDADRLVGGAAAVLVIDDTGLPKKGRHSVGVAPQYCGQLGKTANCQVLVSTTLAGREVPVCLGLKLYLPEEWAADQPRRARAGVPDDVGFRPKWQIALDEIDRVIASGAQFGCVLSDAEYGKVPEFRAGLCERARLWAVGIGPKQKVYPADVTLRAPVRSAAQASGAVGGKPEHRQPDGRPAGGGLAQAVLARGNEGGAPGGLCGAARAGGGRSQDRGWPAPARRRRSLAGGRGARRW